MIKNNHKKTLTLYILFFSICSIALSQNTRVKGVIRDSITNETLPYAFVFFEDSKIGAYSNTEGRYNLSGNNTRTDIVISMMGYEIYKFRAQKGVSTTKDILLQPKDMQLNEVVVKPKKVKYSKKDNPAVELIKKVIAHKDSNNIRSQDYYQYEEYERTIMALNDFKPDQPQFKRYKFLSKYMDSSIIDNKKILPLSVRERITDVYYRKTPKVNKEIIKGYKLEGLDQALETEAIDAVIKEVFQNIDINDNSITLLLHNFVGPLSDHNAVNFYKWYIEDTLKIDGQNYIQMSFAPFNSRDLGFTGYLYISTDGSYGVKKAMLRTPYKMNINFVDHMVIHLDFNQNEYGKWVPNEQRMAIDLSLLDAIKVYVDKTKSYNNFVFNTPTDSVYQLYAPVSFEKNYLKRTDDFWKKTRPLNYQEDHQLGTMMQELYSHKFIKGALIAGNLIATGYIATHKDPEKNLVDIGTIPTFFSYNSVESGRFRLTGATTKNLHPHLYLYSYTAYGLKDNKFKYMAEVTWAFNKIEKHKEEYPRNNLSATYKYDMNNLGQRFTQAERDNIFMSIRSSKRDKVTYSREIALAYEREYYGGFSTKISGQLFDDRPAGKLVFEKRDVLGNIERIRGVKTTEMKLNLRYAHNEKYYQQRRRRTSIPAERFIVELSHNTGLKGVLGGEYNFNKSGLSISAERWVAPYGKITASADVEKIWGNVPYPLLLSPSANNSITIQKGSFYLIEPLEFVHDAQVSWEIYYHMGGWLFNRIPLLNGLKWREIFGFRGLYGQLSNKNNPKRNRDLFIFPEESYTTNRNPYMEYNIGIENIFKFFRIDYVRRINYLGHPDVSKDGIRISFDMTF